MAHEVMRVDYPLDTTDGQLLRFSGTAKAVAALRDVFERLAAGETVVRVDGLQMHGLDALEFRQGHHGGLRLADAEPILLVFDGDRQQWEARARLLDPLAEEDPGFQHLDYSGQDEFGVVVSTYPDGSF